MSEAANHEYGGVDDLGPDALLAAVTDNEVARARPICTTTGRSLLADALDQVHRHPLLWSAVQQLSVPAWKARKVARATHALSRQAAAYVDRQLAGRVASAGPIQIERVIAQAMATFHPAEHARRESRGKESWDVRLVHPRPEEFVGSSEIWARGDTLDLTKFHDLVCETAGDLAALGDNDPLGARKAKALGVLADQQASLDLHALLGTPVDPDGGSERFVAQPVSQPVAAPTPRTAKTRLYLHLDLADLDEDLAVGAVERLGPATMQKIRDWVGDSRTTIWPVLWMNREDAVDTHDPPAWMRELVILRDRHCVFPWCQRDARSCDMDHIDPYDEHGPPGQTRPDNLAPLCRRHHRAKTAGRWRYRRRPDGSYEWCAPGERPTSSPAPAP